MEDESPIYKKESVSAFAAAVQTLPPGTNLIMTGLNTTPLRVEQTVAALQRAGISKITL